MINEEIEKKERITKDRINSLRYEGKSDKGGIEKEWRRKRNRRRRNDWWRNRKKKDRITKLN